jgi:hypothetical protein
MNTSTAKQRHKVLELELEMQNKELRRANEELRSSKDQIIHLASFPLLNTDGWIFCAGMSLPVLLRNKWKAGGGSRFMTLNCYLKSLSGGRFRS